MLLSENVDNIVRKIIKRKSGIYISDNLLGKILKQEILAWHKQEVNKMLDELEKVFYGKSYIENKQFEDDEDKYVVTYENIVNVLSRLRK